MGSARYRDLSEDCEKLLDIIERLCEDNANIVSERSCYENFNEQIEHLQGENERQGDYIKALEVISHLTCKQSEIESYKAEIEKLETDGATFEKMNGELRTDLKRSRQSVEDYERSLRRTEVVHDSRTRPPWQSCRREKSKTHMS